MDHQDWALHYVALGYGVFPCEPGEKTPLARWAPNGSKSATHDPDRVKTIWTNQPDANVAIATGDESGLVVIDLDGDAGELAYGELLLRLGSPGGSLGPEYVDGATVKTPGGGWHLYFGTATDIPNSASKVAPHVDVRGRGGYVLAPPSVHPSGGRYVWRNPPKEGNGVLRLPLLSHEWRMALSHEYAKCVGGMGEAKSQILDRPPPPARTELPEGTDMDRYGIAALRRACDDISQAEKGTRNHTLNQVSYAMGKLVGAGRIRYESAFQALVAAARQAGLEAGESEKTVKSGLASGMRDAGHE